MSKLSEWLDKKFEGNPCALPPHLRNWQGTGKPKLHNDWFLPFLRWIPRSYNAFGPRCTKGSPGYRHWPPCLIEGYGVSRWETANDRIDFHSIIEIPSLADRLIKSDDVYGKSFTAIERAQGHPDFGRDKVIRIEWEEAKVEDWQDNHGEWYTSIAPNNYFPSALQYFSKKGWMKLDPDYYSQWNWFLRYPHEEPMGKFMRSGYRNDALDVFYNRSLITFGAKGE